MIFDHDVPSGTEAGRFRAALALIVVLALLLRILVVFGSGLPWYSTDSHGYLDMAAAILAGEPMSYFPNGYPLLIALLSILVGTAALPQALMVFNIVASTVVVCLTGLIGSRIGGSVGLLAALAVAVYP